MSKGKTQTIITLEEGWKENTLYLVEVSFREGNPRHQSYFYSGFLNGKDNGPGGYNRLWSPRYEEDYDIRDVLYMKVLKKVHTRGEQL